MKSLFVLFILLTGNITYSQSTSSSSISFNNQIQEADITFSNNKRVYGRVLETCEASEGNWFYYEANVYKSSGNRGKYFRVTFADKKIFSGDTPPTAIAKNDSIINKAQSLLKTDIIKGNSGTNNSREHFDRECDAFTVNTDYDPTNNKYKIGQGSGVSEEYQKKIKERTTEEIDAGELSLPSGKNKVEEIGADGEIDLSQINQKINEKNKIKEDRYGRSYDRKVKRMRDGQGDPNSIYNNWSDEKRENRETKLSEKKSRKMNRDLAKGNQRYVKRRDRYLRKLARQAAPHIREEKEKKITELEKNAQMIKRDIEQKYNKEILTARAADDMQKVAELTEEKQKLLADVDAQVASEIAELDQQEADLLARIRGDQASEGQNDDQAPNYSLTEAEVAPKVCNEFYAKDDFKQISIDDFSTDDVRTCSLVYGDKMYSKSDLKTDFKQRVIGGINFAVTEPLGHNICSLVETKFKCSEFQKGTGSVDSTKSRIDQLEDEIAKVKKQDWIEDQEQKLINKMRQENVSRLSEPGMEDNIISVAKKSVAQEQKDKLEELSSQLSQEQQKLANLENSLVTNEGKFETCIKRGIAHVYNEVVPPCTGYHAVASLSGHENVRSREDKEGNQVSQISSWDNKYQCFRTETAADWKSCRNMINIYNSIFAAEQGMNTAHMVEGNKFQKKTKKEITSELKEGQADNMQYKGLDISQQSIELAAKQEERKMILNSAAVASLLAGVATWVTPRNIGEKCDPSVSEDCILGAKYAEAHQQHTFPNFQTRGMFMMEIAKYGSQALASMLLKKQLKDQANAIGQYKEKLDTLTDEDGQEVMVTQCQVNPNHPNCRTAPGTLVRHEAFNPHGGRNFGGAGIHQDFDSTTPVAPPENKIGDYMADNENYDEETLGKIGDVLSEGSGKKTGKGTFAPPPASVRPSSGGAGGGGGGGGGASAQGTGNNFSAKGIADAQGKKNQEKLEVNSIGRGKSKKKGGKADYYGGYNPSRSNKNRNARNLNNPFDNFMGKRNPAGKKGGALIDDFSGRSSISRNQKGSIFARIKKRYHKAYTSDRLLTHK